MPDVTRPFDFVAFFWVFSYIIDEYSCLKYCIFTKHSQIVCQMPNVTAGYGWFSDSIVVFWFFIHYFDHSYLNCYPQTSFFLES